MLIGGCDPCEQTQLNFSIILKKAVISVGCNTGSLEDISRETVPSGPVDQSLTAYLCFKTVII